MYKSKRDIDVSTMDKYADYIDRQLPDDYKGQAKDWLENCPLQKDTPGVFLSFDLIMFCNGDVYAAIMLAYLHMRSGWSTKKSSPLISHQEFQHIWLVNTFAELSEHTNIPEKTIRNALDRLTEQKLIIRESHVSPFGNKTKSLFLRMNWNRFIPEIKQFLLNKLGIHAQAKSLTGSLVVEQTPAEGECQAHTYSDISNKNIRNSASESDTESGVTPDAPTALSFDTSYQKSPEQKPEKELTQKMGQQLTGTETTPTPNPPVAPPPFSPIPSQNREYKPIPKPVREEKEKGKGLQRGNSTLRAKTPINRGNPSIVAKKPFNAVPSVSTPVRAQLPQKSAETPQTPHWGQNVAKDVTPVEKYIFDKIRPINRFIKNGQLSADARPMIHEPFADYEEEYEVDGEKKYRKKLYTMNEMWSGDGLPYKGKIWTGNPQWRTWVEEVLDREVAKAERTNGKISCSIICAMLMDIHEFREWSAAIAQQQPDEPYVVSQEAYDLMVAESKARGTWQE